MSSLFSSCVVAYYFIATPGPASIVGYLALLVVLGNVIPTFVRGDKPPPIPALVRRLLGLGSND
jgi:hypothetical protein